MSRPPVLCFILLVGTVAVSAAIRKVNSMICYDRITPGPAQAYSLLGAELLEESALAKQGYLNPCYVLPHPGIS